MGRTPDLHSLAYRELASQQCRAGAGRGRETEVGVTRMNAEANVCSGNRGERDGGEREQERDQS
jgi:hypothetical protein